MLLALYLYLLPPLTPRGPSKENEKKRASLSGSAEATERCINLEAKSPRPQQKAWNLCCGGTTWQQVMFVLNCVLASCLAAVQSMLILPVSFLPLLFLMFCLIFGERSHQVLNPQAGTQANPFPVFLSIPRLPILMSSCVVRYLIY